MLIDGVLAGLKEALDERLVDNRHRLAGFVVRPGEGAAAHDLHAEVLHIVGAHAVPRRARFLVQLGRRMACNQDQLAPVVSERVVKRESAALDAGQAVEPILDRAVKRRELGRGVSSGWTQKVHQHASLDFVPEILMLELVQASSQHGGAGDQRHRERRLDNQQCLAGE